MLKYINEQKTVFLGIQLRTARIKVINRNVNLHSILRW